MRCFIAIELDKETRSILSEVQKELMNLGIRGKFTRDENLHLTLKFLGEIEAPIFNDICKLIKKISVNNQLFVLELERLGKFDKGSKKILWAGISENKNLLSVFRNLESGLEAIMPIKKEISYSPHITLAREATFNLHEIEITKFNEKLVHAFEAKGISLMESTRVDGKLTYVRRAFVSFTV